MYGWLFGKRRWRAWVVANVLYVVAAVLVATLGGFWLIGAGMLVFGVASGLLQPITTVVLTTQVPDALRGRVFGAYSALAMAAAPLGLGALTVVLATADLGTAAWLLAAGWVLVSAFALVAPGLQDYIRDQTETGEPVPAAEDVPAPPAP